MGMEFKFLENLGRDLRDSVLQLLRDYSEALVLATIMALVLRMFVFSAYKISNLAMEPNLKLGDFIVGYKLPYGVSLPFSDIRMGRGVPHRGDVLVFKCPKNTQSSCVKRVVGLPGDRIEIRGQRLIINGRKAAYRKSDEQPSQLLTRQGQFVSLYEKFHKEGQLIIISAKGEKANFGPYVVPPDSFFALGDNRDFSEDSRHWGAVPFTAIESKALLVWLSIEWIPVRAGEFDSSMRWNRIFSAVH